MEKQQANSKPRNKILKLLPKAAGAVVSYQNLPFSPNRDNRSSDYNHPNKLPPRAPPHHHHHHHHHYHFSGPMIPEEARKKSKNDETIDQEPTSPKVSCMGQIKQRHKEKKNKIKKAAIKNNKKSFSLPKDIKQPSSSSSSLVSPGHELKKQASKIRRIFTLSKHSRSKSNVYADDDHHDHHENNNIESPVQLPERAPGLSQMRRFASGHSALADFDWTAQISPVDSDHRNYYSDEERGNSTDEEEHEEVIIPFSAPMMIGGGGVALQPRNEINLWKRRTMNPPRPLQLNPMIKAKS